jgi:hypothetical protein
MKKNLFKSSIMVSAVLIFAACQKESISPDKVEVSGQAVSKGKPEAIKVKTTTEAGVTKTYSYDENGKTLGYTDSYGNHYTYQYPDATHVIETPTIFPVVNYELNAKGLAIKSTTGSNPYQWFYTYNAKKQLTKKLSTDGTNASVINYNYVNGNLDNEQAISNDVLVWNRTYTYYEKSNVLDNDVFGEMFRGVGSKSLIKSSMTEEDGETTVMNFSYLFDNLGRVTKMMRTQNGLAVPDVTYTYY